MRVTENRLAALRAELGRRKLDGFIVPQADEHLSEFVGSYAQRLAWLTGFKGSAGLAIVMPSEAAIFVDGRYAEQVRQQVDACSWDFASWTPTDIAQWLRARAGAEMRIGYDPWLHTKGWLANLRQILIEGGADLSPVSENPIDAVWVDRPPPPSGRLLTHPEGAAGEGSADKRAKLASWMAHNNADATVLCALDSIAWLFNLRGQDIPYTPVSLAYAVVHADSSADLFVASEKVTPDVLEHLGEHVRLHSRDQFRVYLKTLSNASTIIDSERLVAGIVDILIAAGARLIEARDPVQIMKAKKNTVEIAAHRAAQDCDAVALTAFLHWISCEATGGGITELSAARRLREFRKVSQQFRDESFQTISAFGPNSAIVHYHASQSTNRVLVPGSLYLVDSGGQYLGGTTDVTRTVSIGSPNAEMQDRFTRVLKGHIALARAVFPAGTRGSQLDMLARQYLWQAGLDYPHGTGHGVGAYLNVHEGPQRIGKLHADTNSIDEPLEAGMILSNEPGYYKQGEYGIRIENLMLVVERSIAGEEHSMLGFDMLTFAPIDRTLINVGMLTMAERIWIDSYHATVAQIVVQHFDDSCRAWLMNVTNPLS